MGLKLSIVFQLWCLLAVSDGSGLNFILIFCNVLQGKPPYDCYERSGIKTGDGYFEADDSPDVPLSLTSNFSNVAEIIVWYNLTQVPTGLATTFPDLTILRMNGCGLQSIKREDFKLLNKLELLSLSNNKIVDLPVDVFSDLNHLETLILSFNQIKVLAPQLLAANKKLDAFSAENNPIEVLPEHFFDENHNLTVAVLDNCLLKSIKVDFTKLKAIKVVSFIHNTCVNATFTYTESKLEQFSKVLKEKC